ncbi:hypothetical protein [Methanobrevibacter sp. UBA212]|uniref:hypothetical protein n=1 Tax=Methanobrevibacter sp. UBA212 TaxID=1915476 RepID=UPI0025D7C65F|nr:hypothetical protein [Methanobrevibacter sp. UBA212]
MKELINRLYNTEDISTNEILDKLIAFQLKKMEDHRQQRLLSEASEQAMENMIELINMRYDKKG